MINVKSYLYARISLALLTSNSFISLSSSSLETCREGFGLNPFLRFVLILIFKSFFIRAIVMQYCANISLFFESSYRTEC